MDTWLEHRGEEAFWADADVFLLWLVAVCILGWQEQSGFQPFLPFGCRWPGARASVSFVRSLGSCRTEQSET